jgi:glutamine synthetase
MVRIPDVDRFEFRLPDGSTNPYLLQAAILAAGLDGLAQHRDPGRRRDNNMYTEPPAPGEVRPLPMNLLDALRALSANESLGKAFGASFIDAYTKLKEREWHEHHAQISEWERQATLDC